MSTFKLKPEKVRHSVDIKTMDELHQKMVAGFQKRKLALPKKKKKLEKLKKKLNEIESKDKSDYTNKDICSRSNLKTNIKELENEIYDIENNISEIEYYSKTDELLMDYYDILEHEDNNLYDEFPELNEAKDSTETKNENDYDILDKLNKLKKVNRKKKKVTKRRKRRAEKQNSTIITDFFGIQTVDEDKEKINVSRAEIYEHYKIITDNEYHSEKLKNSREIKKCVDCKKEKTLNQSEGIYVCENCGVFEMVIVESEKPNYKDSGVPDKPGYPYKRIKIGSEKYITIFIWSSGNRKIIVISNTGYFIQ